MTFRKVNYEFMAILSKNGNSSALHRKHTPHMLPVLCVTYRPGVQPRSHIKPLLTDFGLLPCSLYSLPFNSIHHHNPYSVGITTHLLTTDEWKAEL